MNPTKTIRCARCHALRWVEDWREDRHEMMSIILGPCGHQVELSARLEWAISSRLSRRLRHVHTSSTRTGVATS